MFLRARPSDIWIWLASSSIQSLVLDDCVQWMLWGEWWETRPTKRESLNKLLLQLIMNKQIDCIDAQPILVEFPSHRTCWILSCGMFTKQGRHVWPTPSHVVDNECLSICSVDFRAQSQPSFCKRNAWGSTVETYTCVYCTSKAAKQRRLPHPLASLGEQALAAPGATTNGSMS